MKTKNFAISLTALFTALTVIGAFIRIPLPIVPITLQTLMVWLSGYFLGYFYGALSQILYLIIGLIGFPVFAQGGGPAYILQPTFGYLLGFPLSAAIIGWMIHGSNRIMTFSDVIAHLKRASAVRILSAGILGMLAVFVPGVTYLYMAGNYFAGLDLSWGKALWTGMLVFLPGDILKLLTILALIRMMTRRYEGIQ